MVLKKRRPNAFESKLQLDKLRLHNTVVVVGLATMAGVQAMLCIRLWLLEFTRVPYQTLGR